MSPNVPAGVVQLVVAAGLLYAWWSGALAVLLNGLTAGVTGRDPGVGLWEAVTAGRAPVYGTSAGE